MSSVINSLSAIKLAALEPSVMRTVAKAREFEIGKRTRFWRQGALVCILANWTGQLLVLVCVMCVRKLVDPPRSPGRTHFVEQRMAGRLPQAGVIFAIFSVGGAIGWPLSTAGQQISRLMSAAASFRRIEVRHSVVGRTDSSDLSAGRRA